MEAEIVQRAGVPFTAIPAAGVHGVGFGRLPGNVARLVRGVLASAQILRRFRPHVLLFTGGYVAVPMAIAGWRRRALLCVPDIEPGLALRFLAKIADQITVTAQESLRHFPRRASVLVAGYPVRTELTAWSREDAVRHLELDPTARTVLVAGGSLGAHSINSAIFERLREHLELGQIVHITGAADMQLARAAAASLPTGLAARYHPFPYLQEIGAAFAAADVAISRSGASILGEYPAFGLPAILVPYPHAWRYQYTNAQYLTQRGAAVMLEDGSLQEQLLSSLKELILNRPRLQAMKAAMRDVAFPGAAQRIAQQLVELAGRESE